MSDPMLVACPECLVGPGRLCRDALNQTCNAHRRRIVRADEIARVESATAEAIASWLEQGMADGSLVGLTLNELAAHIRAGRWRKP